MLSIEQLFKETGIGVKSINFCDPQSGKGACDRLAAVIKCSIRLFINARNNCTNAIEILQTSGDILNDFLLLDILFKIFTKIERNKGIELYAGKIENPHEEKVERKGVKQINNIAYSRHHTAQSTKISGEIRAWRSWKIGPGKVYRWLDLEEIVTKISPLNVYHSTNVSTPWITDSYEKAGNITILFF